MKSELVTPRFSSLAPWAEVVPGVGPMTIDDFSALEEDEWQYELVDGVLVRMPMSGGEASSIAIRLAARLGVYVEDHDLGVVTGADGGYIIDPVSRPNTELGPDVAFVRAARVPAPTSPSYSKAWPLAPDLVVEVVSPSQYGPGLAEKARQYLAAGTRLVWIVWPRYRRIDVWRPGDSNPSATVDDSGMLDGEEVVPGFSYQVERLFA
ncbi:MAG TPA: Uma2 family endonuclease [Chloroflexota bacterium]|nr:Uma2 family endonuclease [Chloroflexota bacterium]